MTLQRPRGLPRANSQIKRTTAWAGEEWRSEGRTASLYSAAVCCTAGLTIGGKKPCAADWGGIVCSPGDSANPRLTPCSSRCAQSVHRHAFVFPHDTRYEVHFPARIWSSKCVHSHESKRDRRPVQRPCVSRRGDRRGREAQKDAACPLHRRPSRCVSENPQAATRTGRGPCSGDASPSRTLLI